MSKPHSRTPFVRSDGSSLYFQQMSIKKNKEFKFI